MGTQSSNELQLLDPKKGHQKSSPYHGRQGDMPYWLVTKLFITCGPNGTDGKLLGVRRDGGAECCQ